MPGNGLPRRAGRQQREKRAALFSEHCMESQEGKQDLGFIGVILGNREIDSQIFILSECVCQLAPIVPRGHPVPRQHYPHTLNTGKVLTLAWLHLLLCISSLVVCRIMKQTACPGRKGCQPCPSPPKCWREPGKPQKPGAYGSRGPRTSKKLSTISPPT